jgi:hypothetical protein
MEKLSKNTIRASTLYYSNFSAFTSSQDERRNVRTYYREKWEGYLLGFL